MDNTNGVDVHYVDRDDDNIDVEFYLEDKKNIVSISTGKKILVIVSIIFLIVSFVFTYCFDWVFENPICDILFKCGCTWNWEGGWDECNVHNTEGEPKCPWCNSQGFIQVLLTKYYLLTYITMGIIWFIVMLLLYKKYIIKRNVYIRDVLPSNYSKERIKQNTTRRDLCKIIIYTTITSLVCGLFSYFIYAFLDGLAWKLITGYPYFIF
eukprot:TRINITY_DN9476_c0_g2_i2.p1 TRINITY_DN9476_c0_g2~~TRINITY_DN9476_c0_g2_i2.p1  ORF type:complete len:209 (+),score=28.65 TRINITY_DN9476_c0_g2_i2:57-683(+)